MDMRRRIIKQGNNSYTLTLPINWIREEKLDQGGEVEVEQEDSHLAISIPKDLRRRESAITLEIKDYNERTVRNILNQAYRKGYDKIIINNPNEKQFEDIREITRNTLLGFEIIREEKNCVVQKIAEPTGENFDAILRKIFFYIADDSQEIMQEFQNKKYDLKKRVYNKNIVDNYTNLCRRLVIKERIGGSKNSYFMFEIVSRLSLIYHAYYYMYKYASEKKLSPSKETLKILSEANEMFGIFHEAFYSKDLDKAHKLGVIKDKLYQELYTLFGKIKGPENVMLYHIGEIIRLTHMQSTNIFGLIEFKS